MNNVPPEGRRKPLGIGCPHRIVVLTGLSSSLDSRSYAPTYLGPQMGPYLGPYRAALFSIVGCPILWDAPPFFHFTARDPIRNTVLAAR